MTDLEWILKRLNAITTGSMTPDQQLQKIAELLHTASTEIGLELD